MNIRDRFQAATDSTRPEAPADDKDPYVGTTLDGRYRVISLIAEGGQGRIYLARHNLIKRDVAIKVLAPAMAADSALLDRFLSEGRAAGTLGHPNIVESIDMGIASTGAPYLVLELLRGTTLGAELLAKGAFSLGRAAYVGAQIAAGLSAAHAKGIIHRDLKPENIFLCSTESKPDHVKIIDFGVSRFVANAVTRQGQVIGTPEYMAPEQIQAPANVDARADVYALGMILYEMLSGRTPFGTEQFPEILHSVVNKRAPSLGELRPTLPPGLVQVVDAALSKSREARPSLDEIETSLAGVQEEPSHRALGSTSQSANRAPAALESANTRAAPRVETTELEAVVPSQAPTASPPAMGVSRRRAAIMVSAAVAAVVLLGALFLWGRASGRAPMHATAATTAPPTESIAGMEAAGATVSAVEPGGDVAVAISAFPANASVAVRGETHALPFALSLPRGTELETLEVTAPHHQGRRVHLKLDRALNLHVTLPPGRGIKDATEDELAHFSTEPAKPQPIGDSALHSKASPASAVRPSLSSTPVPAWAVPSDPVVVPPAPPPSSTSPEPTAPAAPIAVAPVAPVTPVAAAGTIEPRAVNATVRAHQNEVRDCFDRAKLRKAELRGRVTVRAVVAPTGAVESVSVASSSADDAPLEACVVGAFRSWTFPAPSGGTAAHLTYTFTFD